MDKNIDIEKNAMDKVYKYISDASSDGYRYVNFLERRVINSKKWKQLYNMEYEQDDEGEFDDVLMNKEESVSGLIYEDDIPAYLDKINRIYDSKQVTYELEYRSRSGEKWILHKGINTYDADGNIVEVFSVAQDITKSKQKQIELEYMAYFDNETGAYNRDYFVKRLQRAINKVKKSCNRVQILYVDIDNYNVLNDTFGFVLGDELICKFANILNKYVNHVLKVGRFNNDEFAIALFDAPDDKSVEYLYEDILKHLEKPIELSNGSRVYITISAGIAKYPVVGDAATDLIRCADIAMSHVKQHGKNGMKIFEKNMLDRFMENVKLEQNLLKAVDNLDFVMLYQPQYYADGKKLRGAEALVRWILPDGKYVSPGDFIPLAEKNGCIVNIGTWVMKQALKEFGSWKNKYGFDGIISINISAIQLKEENFCETLFHYTEKYGLSPANVEIEITETVLIEDFESTLEVLRNLKNKGYKISLDDFGTGYSSLSYLKDIPIDTLKIDKSFVDSMLEDNSTGIITDAVISMVKKLGLETIAEGVETEDQYEYLKKMECDNIQGFLMGKPMPGYMIVETIMKNNKMLRK